MDKIILKVKPYIQELFSRRTPSFLKYHNLAHTEKVVERTIEISKASPVPLNEKDFFCVITAAWFHDTGHLFNELKDHEQAGADLMAAFLKSFQLEDSIINEAAGCIMATRVPSNPKTAIEQIICDADTYHLGTRDFQHLDKLVWQELELRLNKPINNKVQRSLLLLENHHFFTGYCRQLLSTGKDRNIAQLNMSL